MMRTRLRLILRGRVQGVGFRPWLYRLARARSLQGSIANTDAGVIADLEGERAELEDLLQVIPTTLPPHAAIADASQEWLAPRGASELRILVSEDGGGRGARIPADLATCDACRAELRDPGDRRHRYPFTNCTGCGPRFTIVTGLPYDRGKTSMRRFALCPACAAEYADPLDRRYHAEPTACPVCGPRLALVDPSGGVLDGDPLEGAVASLSAGGILAVKGLGGFHLAVDPLEGAALERLRQRKGRAQKPFAVMVRDLDEARRHAVVSEAEAAILGGSAAPIVLLRRAPGSDLHSQVAPGNPFLGIMLPYTPLHHLLLQAIPALVMTSGNRSEEPIATGNEEARARLATVADLFLEHDREILVACDDSVLRVDEQGSLVLRRSRGFVPDPILLGDDAGQILATGGQLKNTFCLTLGREAFLGPHVGDLEHLESYEHYQRAVQHLQELLRLRPEAVVHDLHPDYLTTRFAEELALPRHAVQHHHAHLAAVAADRGLVGPLLGLALDGTGYGSDGSIWGGELLLLPDLGCFQRLGHLRPFALPGGDACSRAPRRTALALIDELLGEEAAGSAAAMIGLPAAETAAVLALVRRRVGTVATTSCGRLFDAVAALLGLGQRVTYEGQPAMELEFLAGAAEAEPYPMAVIEGGGGAADQGGGAGTVLDPAPALRAILDDLQRGVPAPVVAARFHEGLVHGLLELVDGAARLSGVGRVLLGGGCFQNQRLLGGVCRGLEERGLTPYLPRQVPVNDGGLALGQAAIVAARRARGAS